MHGDVDGDGWKRKMKGGMDGKRGTGEVDKGRGRREAHEEGVVDEGRGRREAHAEGVVDEGRGREEVHTEGSGRRVRGGTSKKVRGGGIIFIGPIPIVFGDSVSMRYLVPAALIILILMIIAALYF